MNNIAERILGGFLTPIAITLGAILFGAHVHGYMSSSLIIIVITVAITNTSGYRRPMPTGRHHRA